MQHHRFFMAGVLVVLCGALCADAAAGTMLRSAASRQHTATSSTASSKEAGQFFGFSINFGGGQQQPEQLQQAVETGHTGSGNNNFIPGVLRAVAAVPNAVAAALGLRPPAQQPKQPTPPTAAAAAAVPKPPQPKQKKPLPPKQQQQPKKPQQAVAALPKPSAAKPTPPAGQPKPQQQPKQQQPQQQPKQPSKPQPAPQRPGAHPPPAPVKKPTARAAPTKPQQPKAAPPKPQPAPKPQQVKPQQPKPAPKAPQKPQPQQPKPQSKPQQPKHAPPKRAQPAPKPLQPKGAPPKPQQQKQQQQQKPPRPPIKMPQVPPSLVVKGPPLKQQQQQKGGGSHQVYYKKPHDPKSHQPVVASEPTYVPPVQPGTVPMCEWRSDFNNCQVHRHFYLAVQEEPSSYIAQMVTAAAARDFACAAYSDPSSCSEASEELRCGWNLSGGRTWDGSGCRSYYMAEWTVFSYLISSGVGAAQSAVGLTNLGAFTCPGSLAQRALECNTAYPMDSSGNYDPNLCATAAPGCTFQAATNNCVMDPQLSAQLAQLQAADVGTCSAACYLRSLAACPAKPLQSSGGLNTPDSCWDAPGCTWANGACGPDLFGSQTGPWGRKVAAAAEACSRESEAWGCGQAGAKGLVPLPSSAAQGGLQRQLPGPGAPDSQCPV